MSVIPVTSVDLFPTHLMSLWKETDTEFALALHIVLRHCLASFPLHIFFEWMHLPAQYKQK